MLTHLTRQKVTEIKWSGRLWFSKAVIGLWCIVFLANDLSFFKLHRMIENGSVENEGMILAIFAAGIDGGRKIF